MKRTSVVLTLTFTLALLLIGCRGVLPDGTLPLSGELTITNSDLTTDYYVMILEPAGSTTTLLITDGGTVKPILKNGGSHSFTVSWLGSAAGESQFVDMETYLDNVGAIRNGSGDLEVIAGQTKTYDLTVYFFD